jgi:putative transposase
MPRPPRHSVTELPLHIVQRGNDRRRCFFEDADFRFYLRALGEAAARHRVLVHAYALMTNHVHLLLTPLVAGGVSRVMQSLGSRYVRRVNARSGRLGTLWESRYRACLVLQDTYVLAVCRYIDLNPVRAGIVARPEDYEWSSYAGLAGLRTDALITPHAALDELGSPRGAPYARWCEQAIAGDELERLREATARGLTYGAARCQTRV